MRIGIDISRAVNEATGVGYYAKNLVRGLARIDAENRYLLYGVFCDCFPKGWRKAEAPEAPNFTLHDRNLPSWYVMWKWKNAARFRENLFGGVDLLHSTAYTMPQITNVKVVVTIHDLSCFAHPEYHTKENCDFVTRNVLRAARRADFIIADSESTRAEIRRFLHVPEERLGVTHLAADERFREVLPPEEVSRVRNKFGISKPYMLAVGSVEPRKNLTSALVAFKALIRIRKADCQFVIAGGQGWKNEAFFRLVQKLDLGERLVITGYVAEDDLVPLYQGAEIFVYPSIYEGFGLPVLEAMSSGVPVITSNTTSLPEVAGDAALLVNPLDLQEIYRAMETLWMKPSLRAELRAKGIEQSRRFSWEKTARETLEIYRAVARS